MVYSSPTLITHIFQLLKVKIWNIKLQKKFLLNQINVHNHTSSNYFLNSFSKICFIKRYIWSIFSYVKDEELVLTFSFSHPFLFF